MEGIALEKLRDWIGKKQTVEDLSAHRPVRTPIATLDELNPEPRTGDPLPPLSLWLYFNKTVPHAKLGRDDHAVYGDLLAPVLLPHPHGGGQPLQLRTRH